MPRLDSRELTEWVAFAELEPFGPMADNINSATIASILYNANKRKHSPAKSVTDMALGDFSEEKQKDLVTALKNMFASHNKGLDKKKKRRGKKKRG